MQFTYTSKTAPGATTIQFLSTADRDKLPDGILEAELSLKPNSRVLYHANDTLYVGLGAKDKVTAKVLRRAAGTAALALRKSGRLKWNVQLDEWPQFAGAVVEGLLTGGYRFEEYKASKTPAPERATIVVKSEDLRRVKADGARGEIIGEAVNTTRDISNQPGNVVTPAALADIAMTQAREYGLKCTVMDEKKLRALKFGGTLAVGEGSARPPRFIVIEHRGGARNAAPIALVGKAVTFDTGGISLKPPAEMEKMIWDKCGGVAVLGAMLAIAALGVKRNVVGLIPSAENMPSHNAYRPGDIVTCFDGKAVEILNTDAEGRMLLADAIGWARQELKAEVIVDVATLTGACGIALGDSSAGLWSTSEKLKEELLAASEAGGEQLWHMPIFPEHEEQIRSEVALLKNSGGRLGGACTAAAFLKAFAEETPWAHLDIAYTAKTDKEHPWQARGATGFAVQTLVHFVENHR